MTYLPMSWDHRALDGAMAARFLGRVKERLEAGRRVMAVGVHGLSLPSSSTPPLAPAVPTTRRSPPSRGARSGVPMIVAIHSTALGPALGGAADLAYPDPRDAERDALRLRRE